MIVSDLFNIFIANTGRLDITSSRFLTTCNEACELLGSLETSKNILFRYVYPVSSEASTQSLPDRFRSVEALKIHYDSTFVEYRQVSDSAIRYLIEAGEENIFAFLPSIISSVLATNLPDSTNPESVATSEATPSKVVLFNPAAPANSFVEIESKSFVSSLTATNSSNYWLDRYPWLVLETINYVLVKDLLNIEEAGKILKDVEAKLRLITYDSFENENISWMEG
jgi:hypothetical protein